MAHACLKDGTGAILASYRIISQGYGMKGSIHMILMESFRKAFKFVEN